MLTFNFDPFPTIETERLLLREVTLEDAPDFFTGRSDPKAMQYICKPLHKTVSETEDLIKQIKENILANSAIAWAITLKEEGKFIGSISYHHIIPEHHRAEVGYMILPPYWKKGIASEALKAVLDHGFTKMKLHSIEAKIDPRNIDSANVLKKNNFVREAYYKEDYLYEGKFLDTEIYSLLTKAGQ